MSKERVGFWLLISLIPTGFFTFVSFLIVVVLGFLYEAEATAAEIFWIFLFAAFLLYWWGALIAGVVLKVWGQEGDP